MRSSSGLHNGLVAAANLADAGWDVLVLEDHGLRWSHAPAVVGQSHGPVQLLRKLGTAEALRQARLLMLP